MIVAEWEMVDAVAKVLLAEEIIDRARFLEILGKDPEQDVVLSSS